MMNEKLELYISDAMDDCKKFLYWHKKGDLRNMRFYAKFAIMSLARFERYLWERENGGELDS